MSIEVPLVMFAGFAVFAGCAGFVARRRGRHAARIGRSTLERGTGPVPAELVPLGMTETLGEAGSPEAPVVARGTIDGVVVEVARTNVSDEGQTRYDYVAAIPLGPIVPGLRIKHEGVRTPVDDIALGDPAFDHRFIVLGSQEAAVLHLTADARRKMLAVVETGWRFDVERLISGSGSLLVLQQRLPAAIATAKALRCDDPVGGIAIIERLAATATTDPCQRMRRRALLQLVTRHAGSPVAREKVAAHAASNDPVMALFAAWHAPDRAGWLARAAAVPASPELAEALAEWRGAEALATLDAIAARDNDEATRTALVRARERLRATIGDRVGALAIAVEQGGLALDDER